jgi:hypothetical protein
MLLLTLRIASDRFAPRKWVVNADLRGVAPSSKPGAQPPVSE